MFLRFASLAAFLLLVFLGTPALAQENRDTSLMLRLQVLLETANKGYQEAETAFLAGKVSSDELVKWSQNVAQAQIELSQARAAAEQLDRLQKAEKSLQALQEKGQLSPLDTLDARLKLQRAMIEIARTDLRPVSGSKTTFERDSAYMPSATTPPPTRVDAFKTTATLAVRLPATATLMIDGVPTKQAGNYREFLVKDLIPDRPYRCEIWATWKENGQDVTPPVRPVNFAAGSRVEIDLFRPAPEPIALPAGAPKP